MITYVFTENDVHAAVFAASTTQLAVLAAMTVDAYIEQRWPEQAASRRAVYQMGNAVLEKADLVTQEGAPIHKSRFMECAGTFNQEEKPDSPIIGYPVVDSDLLDLWALRLRQPVLEAAPGCADLCGTCADDPAQPV